MDIYVNTPPDSNTDIGPSIQNAVNQALAASIPASEPRNVYIPAGDWRCDQLPNNYSWSGGAIFINLKNLPRGAWLNLIGLGALVAVKQQNNITIPVLVPNCILRSKVPNNNNLAQPICTFNITGSDFESGANPDFTDSIAKHIRLANLTVLGYVTSEPSLGGMKDNSGINIMGCDNFVIDNCAVDSHSGADISVSNSKGVIAHTVVTGYYYEAIGGIWNYGISLGGNFWPPSVSPAFGKATWIRDVTKIWGKYNWQGIPLDYDTLPVGAWTPTFPTGATSNIPFTAGPVYIEDSWFDRCRHSVTSSAFAYYVLRHSTILRGRPGGFPLTDMHGGTRYNIAETAYAARFGEFYDNYYDGVGQDPSNPNGIGNTSYGPDTTGGGMLLFNNTMKNLLHGILVQARTGNPLPDDPQYPWNTWIWYNSIINCTNISLNNSNINAGKNYFNDNCNGYASATNPAPLLYINPTNVGGPRDPNGISNYVPYVYPHPLISGLVAQLLIDSIPIKTNFTIQRI